jgi:hypothetical protein
MLTPRDGVDVTTPMHFIFTPRDFSNQLQLIATRSDPNDKETNLPGFILMSNNETMGA